MTNYTGMDLTNRQISFWEEQQYELENQIEFYEEFNNWYLKLPILIFSLGVGNLIIADRLKKLKQDLCSVNNKLNQLESQLNFLKTKQSVESKRLYINGQNKEISRHTQVSTANTVNNSSSVNSTQEDLPLLFAASLYTSNYDTSSSSSSSSSDYSSSSSSDSGSCGCD